MKIPLSIQIGYRYAKAAKDGKFISFISLFSIAGIALGVMSLILILSVMNGFEGVLKQRILGAVPHVIVKSNQLSIDDLQQTIDSSIYKDKVNQIVPLVQSQAIVQMPGDLKGVLTQGLHQSFLPEGVRDKMVDGDWQKLFDKKYGVVISQYMAMEYGLNIGDKIRLLVSGVSHYTPIGRMPAQRSFTIVGLFDTQSEIDNQMIMVRARDLNRLLKAKPDSNQGFRLVLSDAFDAQSVMAELKRLLPTADIQSWHHTHGKLFDAVKMEKTMMWTMLSLIILVAAFNIVSALVMMVTQKQSEIAILKTLGFKAKNIRRVFIFQGAYNGLIGATFGALLGVFIVLNLNNFMLFTGINLLGAPGQGLPIELDIEKIIWVFGFAVSLAYLASIYPAYKAAQLLPAKVLRHE
jgi:lipoprotein-releasing system permease protein